ncbi:hypothetical protein AQZ52_10805 [Novosphingobium fuchskuhlense]|uniref:Uncharacterized protein n=1 Tax=Novosphingobium fuchskuhlense TaxID=1117702 RepID=A0A117UUN2_9SPHN|nr:hypothetical protein [Novosphingobium fuchskuhlense]KUR71153.1 hypothetical protein AQZ52_10805 [Novosphingobium fuchskuhlense]
MTQEPNVTQADDGPCTDCWNTGITVQTERACTCDAGACHRTASAPAGEVVLRWEGDDLMLGQEAVVMVFRGGFNRWYWAQYGPPVGTGTAATEAEAKSAAEQAVRDWLARVGLAALAHPSGDVADLVEALERIASGTDIGGPDAEVQCARIASAALAKHRTAAAGEG